MIKLWLNSGLTVAFSLQVLCPHDPNDRVRSHDDILILYLAAQSLHFIYIYIYNVYNIYKYKNKKYKKYVCNRCVQLNPDSVLRVITPGRPGTPHASFTIDPCPPRALVHTGTIVHTHTCVCARVRDMIQHHRPHHGCMA